MKQGEMIYLRPLFLRNMSKALHLSQEKLCSEAASLIAERLDANYKKLIAIIDEIGIQKVKENRSICQLRRMYRKIETGSGGYQIKVLFCLDTILKELEKWKFLNKDDADFLKKILKTKFLFFSPYNTGIESRTITRLFDINDNQNQRDHNQKTRLICEVFAKYLHNADTKNVFFAQYLLDRTRVKSAFFSYQGLQANFDNVDILADEVLGLKGLAPNQLVPALDKICHNLEIIGCARMMPYFETTYKDKEVVSERDYQENSDYTDFHASAIGFLKRQIFLEIAQINSGEDYAQVLYPIIDDAWYVFIKICNEKHIKVHDQAYTLLLKELILHSLHKNEEVHLHLCECFKKWQ